MPSAESGGRPFYVTGGTLPLSATSYVERAADAALVAALRRAGCGEFCYVLNTRQMGKSSLMARTAGLLRQAGASVAVLDLTALGQNLTVAQWYNGLLTYIGEQLGLEYEMSDYWRAHADAGPMRRFLAALRDVALPAVPGELVIFIDEIDAVRSLPFATDELFAGIRELYNRRTENPELNRLTFCLLGVATPADLIRDTRTTPFNIGTRIDLDDFTPAEAAPLAQGMVGSRAVLDRVLYWTGGHPYLTQRLCRAVADEPQAITKSAQVDALCERLFLSLRARDTEDNLLFVRDRILRSGLDLASLLTLYAKVGRGRPAVRDDPADPHISALKLAGVVKADVSGRLQVRNRIYARVFGRSWVAENMPGAEVRRLRRAFRRGAVRAGVVAAVIIAVIGTLAGLAVKEAREARRQSAEARRQAARFERLLYVSDMQNAQTAWDDGNLGRLRGLLTQTESSPERGFEWGYWNHLAHPPGNSVQVGSAPLVACDATKDGTKLLTAGGDGMLRLWDARTLRQLYSIGYPGSAIIGVGFSTDGSRWQANDAAGGLTIYDTVSGRRLFEIPSAQPGNVSDASHDLKFAFRFVHDVGLTFLSCDTGKRVGFLPSPSGSISDDVLGASANVHEKAFLFRADPLLASIYDMTNGHCLCRLQLPPRLRSTTEISSAFSDDDRTLVTLCLPASDYDLWDATTGRLIRHLDNVLQATASFDMTDPDAPLVLIRSEDRLHEYSTRTGRQLLNCPYPETSGELMPNAFSPDGRYLGFVGASGAIFLLDCKTGKSAGRYLGHTAASAGVAFLPQDRQFISISADGSLRRWNRGWIGQERWNRVRFPWNVDYGFAVMHKHQSRALLYEASGRVSLWRIAADCAERIRFLPVIGGATWANSGDTTTTTWTTRGEYIEYDLGDGHLIGRWTCDRSHIDVASVSRDGRYLASYSTSGMTSVTDMRGNTRLWSVRGSNSSATVLKFSSSGRLVASGGSEGLVDVWEAHTGRKVATLSGSTGAVQSLIILQGDRHLAAAFADQTMRCWDIVSGRLLWTVQTPQATSPYFLRLSPDANRLLMTSQSGLIFLWDAATGDQLLRIRAPGHDPNFSSSFDGSPTGVGELDAEFSPDGTTIEASDSRLNYINYVADMRPHDDPPSSGVSSIP